MAPGTPPEPANGRASRLTPRLRPPPPAAASGLRGTTDWLPAALLAATLAAGCGQGPDGTRDNPPAPTAAAAQAPARHSVNHPRRAVRQAADELALVIDAASKLPADQSERLLALIEPLLAHLDRTEITRLLLGRPGAGAGAAERADFADALFEQQLALHARALPGLQGFELRLLANPSGSEPTDQGRAVVPVAVSARGLPETTLDLHLVRTEDRWRLYDVSLFGVGLIGLQRPVFTALAAEHGVDGLAALIRGDGVGR